MRALALIVAMVALTACSAPERPEVKIIRSCGLTWVWGDESGHRWVGLDNNNDWLKPIAPGANLDQICGGKT